MEVQGKVKFIGEVQEFGTFKKREIVVTTQEQYPQQIMMEFVQDKTDLLNDYKINDGVKISINLRGREWVNPEGVSKYFNTIQGWRIDKAELEAAPSVANVAPVQEEGDDILPF